MNRIHWLSPGDPNQRTGGYLYNARIASALREHGVDVIVHALPGPWPWPQASQKAQLELVPDDALVIADGLMWPGLRLSERTALCDRCTVWVVMHSLMDMEDGAPGLADAEVSALRQADGWFATSERTARILSERMGGASGSVVVPGTVPRVREDSHVPKRGKLLNVAHLIPRKNQKALLQALAAIPDLDWQLDIVGSLNRDPYYASSVESCISELGLTDRVHLHGELDELALEKAYSQSSCLIHTADFEAYGMVLTEALARGLSVISTPAGALDVLNSPQITQVGHGDVDGLTRAIRMHLQASNEPAVSTPNFPTWKEQASLLMRVLELEEEGFSVDWLRMREPYDHDARSVDLAHAFDAALGSDAPQTVMEIATGLGSGTRFLSREMRRSVTWLLVDRDHGLLSALASDMGACGVDYRTHQHDLRDLLGLTIPADGVTTQALLDLVSYEWLEQFAEWLADRRVPFLGALSVDGRVSWSPSDPRDDAIQHAFRTHQTWDRGFGASPGPAAATVLKKLLVERGFEVRLEQADWEIPASDTPMMSAMVEGIASAAREAADHAGVDVPVIDAWRTARLSLLGALSVRVGHLDLLATP